MRPSKKLLFVKEYENSNIVFLFIGIAPAPTSPTKRPLSPDHPNPALPITETPSPAMGKMGWALRTLLVTDNSSCLKDRKVNFIISDDVILTIQFSWKFAFIYK